MRQFIRSINMVRKNLTSKRWENRQIIIEIMREHQPMSIEKLKETASKQMSYQTFRRWYNKLIDEGEIIAPTLVLASSYKEADRFEVAELTQLLSSENTDKSVLRGRLEQLEIISRNSKVAHIPNVMNSLDKCLEKDIVKNSVELIDVLTHILCNIYVSETEHPIQESNEIIREIHEPISSQVNKIIENNHFPTPWTFSFFRLSGNLDSINILFTLLSKYPEKVKESNFAICLARSGDLYKKYHSEINSRLDELGGDPDEKLQSLSSYLRKIINQN